MLFLAGHTKSNSPSRLLSLMAGFTVGLISLGPVSENAWSQEAVTNTVPAKPVGLQSNGNGNGNGNDNGNNGKAKGKSKPTVAERPQVIGSKGNSNAETKGKPDRPGNPNTTEPAEVTTYVNQFQNARQEYLEAQKELKLKMKDATEEQRAVLREKVKEALEKWKEDHKQFVEEQKERVKAMKQELQPDLGKVLDGAGGDGGNGRGR
jgi:hypothetical protein